MRRHDNSMICDRVEGIRGKDSVRIAGITRLIENCNWNIEGSYQTLYSSVSQLS